MASAESLFSITTPALSPRTLDTMVTTLPLGLFSTVTGIPPFFVPPTWNTMATTVCVQSAASPYPSLERSESPKDPL